MAAATAAAVAEANRQLFDASASLLLPLLPLLHCYRVLCGGRLVAGTRETAAAVAGSLVVVKLYGARLWRFLVAQAGLEPTPARSTAKEGACPAVVGWRGKRRAESGERGAGSGFAQKR